MSFHRKKLSKHPSYPAGDNMYSGGDSGIIIEGIDLGFQANGECVVSDRVAIESNSPSV